MAKLVMRREGSRLACQSPVWLDILMELPEGIDLNVTATRARSLPQLGTYWGLLAFVIEHGPEWISRKWLDKDELSDALQLEVGFVRQIGLRGLPEGVTYAVPASKSFSECSQEKFNTYFNAVQDVLRRWCDFDPVPTYQRWMQERHGRSGFIDPGASSSNPGHGGASPIAPLNARGRELPSSARPRASHIRVHGVEATS